MRALTVKEWAKEAGITVVAVHTKLKNGLIKTIEGQDRRMIDAEVYPPQKLKRGRKKGSKNEISEVVETV